MEYPTNRVDVFNTNLPFTGTGFFTAITPKRTPCLLRVYITVTVAGVLSLSRTKGGVTVTETLNQGNALVAGAAYMFPIAVSETETITLTYSVPPTGNTCTNNTGTATGSPITLVIGSNTVVVTGAGTFDIALAAGVSGVATSGTATLAGSPVTCAAGATTTVDTGATTGNFTIVITGGVISKLQIDETWNG